MKTRPIDKSTVRTNGIQESVSFGIKKDGIPHLFGILRNQLYSNKILAVVREYSTNAVDAHIEAGKPNLPIEVTIPNRMNPYFKVRDFGPSLNDEEIREVYAFYGESTKRNTNSQTGMLGIGSKSAFAYGDNFVINSYIGGKKHIYNAFIDPTQVGQISKLGTEDTSEKDGLEIVVPVNEQDVEEFRDTAENLFTWFKVRPDVKGTKFNYENNETLFSGDDWYWRKNGDSYSHNANAVMGNIGYPIDLHSLNLKEEDHSLTDLIKENLVLEFEIGDLEISANREALQYTDYTRKNIIKKLRTVKKELIETLSKDFANCKTMFEAKCFYGEVFDYGSGLYAFRNVLAQKLKWKGQQIKSENYYVNEDGITLKVYKKSHRSQKHRAEETCRIDCRKNVVIIKKDIPNARGILNRVLPLIHDENKKVYLIATECEKTLKKFCKENDLDCEMILLSSLPKRPLKDFAGYNSYSGDGYERDKKHVAKAFTYKGKGQRWGRGSASSWWETTDVDINAGGIYVEISRFEIDGSHPSYLKNQLEAVKELEIDIPVIYGFKPSMAHKIKEKSNWIKFSDWIKEQVCERVKLLDLEQKYVDRSEAKKMKGDWLTMKEEDFKKFKKQIVCKDSEFVLSYEMYHEMLNVKDEKILTTAFSLATEHRFKLTFDGKPTHNLSLVMQAAQEKYDMLSFLSEYDWHWHMDKDKMNKLVNYINVIDVCNASSMAK